MASYPAVAAGGNRVAALLWRRGSGVVACAPVNELRVPKHAAPVEVVLAGGATDRVVIFLADYASTHAGAERLSDLLNGTADFLPAREVATGRMTFLNRQGIALARVDPELERGADTDWALPSEHRVAVALSDGTRLTGRVRFVLPPAHSRLVDFLNDAPPFFALFEGEKVAFVNKRFVVRVDEISES